jgi:hypothetical protein
MLERFAGEHKLRVEVSPDDAGGIIDGRNGQIYEYSVTELAVSFTPGLDNNSKGVGSWCPKKWGNIRRAAVAAGMILRQNGDSEGSISFDPWNREQARLAIKIAKVRPKRVLSPEHKAKLLASSPLVRNSAARSILNGHLGDCIERTASRTS